MDMKRCSCGGPIRDRVPLHGVAEILVRHKGILVDRFVEHNIIFFQGQGEIIRTLATVSPSTAPRIINRMAVGDQGTIPADPTVPKVPTEDLPQLLSTKGLYHEIYREDVQSRTITINPGATFVLPATLTINQPLVTVANTAGLAAGMTVVGAGVPLNTIIININSGIQFTMSNNATVSGATSLTIAGASNQAQFVATFNASDVALSAFSNPSQPRINEVGLVIINPVAPDGIVRAAVTAPNPPPTDEVVMSIRTFKSVPFEVANDVSITIRYTIFME